MVQAAQIPEATIGTIEVPYFGRKVKIAGDRTFADWTVTCINDEDFVVRNGMEAWMNAINTHDSNLRALPQDYKSNGIITQYSKDGDAIRTYVFEGMYPTQVDQITMDWGTTDQIEEFTVNFSYDFWRVEGATGIPTT